MNQQLQSGRLSRYVLYHYKLTPMNSDYYESAVRGAPRRLENSLLKMETKDNFLEED